MHFVKKVPTSEEEKAAKRKEHEKRAQQFLRVRDRIVAKRDKGEYDEEILSLTQQILEKNADIYTFWNIRRTAIEQRIEANRNYLLELDVLDEEKAKSAQKVENLLAGELFLSYECIKSNPKSYSAWYQRAWVLQRQANPDYVKELALCEKALQMDCRNFHCWDHRRTVSRMAKRTEEQELEFSNRLIEENFSNYSAWHYRSIALTKIHCDEKSVKLDDSILAAELQTC
uniref:Geranylgeranyl transferase type-2 subunit alpha n=2 Tax=Caenorhabditis japonica TaxID=281687 RepID=A0A8R1I144_CAEJA